MEQVINTQVTPEQHAPIGQLLLIILIALVMVMLGAMGLTRIIRPRASPFVAFANIAPGQPRATLEEEGFSCLWVDDYYYHVAEERCTLHPNAGIFSSINVVYSAGKVKQTTFMLRENALTVGDLTTYLGQPAVHTLPNTVLFSLPDKFIVARTSPTDERDWLFVAVWSVSLADTP